MSDIDLAGKKVLIRADLNVPQNDAGVIMDDTRITASIPAIQYALDHGAAVMVTSHLGRPLEGQFSHEDSLAPITLRIADLLGRKVPLVSDWVENGVRVAPGEIVMLENCRLNIGEKANDENLAKKLPSCVMCMSMMPLVRPIGPKQRPMVWLNLRQLLVLAH